MLQLQKKVNKSTDPKLKYQFFKYFTCSPRTNASDDPVIKNFEATALESFTFAVNKNYPSAQLDYARYLAEGRTDYRITKNTTRAKEILSTLKLENLTDAEQKVYRNLQQQLGTSTTLAPLAAPTRPGAFFQLPQPAAPAQSKVVNVFSIDMDGCLFHEEPKEKLKDLFKNTEFMALLGNLNPPEKQDQITNIYKEGNGQLINFIKDIPGEKVIMCGSNRQSREVDSMNMYKIGRKYSTGSVFPLLDNLCPELTVNRALMTDVYCDKPCGTSWRQAVDSFKNGEKTEDETQNRPGWLFDDTKFTLIYYQIHHMANKHPGKTVHFHFIDDRLDILEPLHEFFQKRPDLIPKNVVLSLRQYNGNEKPNPLKNKDNSLAKDIQGERITGINPAETIKTFAKALLSSNVTLEEALANPSIDYLSTDIRKLFTGKITVDSDLKIQPSRSKEQQVPQYHY